ncbi:MAG: hypothetical protein IPK16_03240 [Anaerolineales bacterium]|nr:hypothetical protein [Anaerolineales bacterium]
MTATKGSHIVEGRAQPLAAFGRFTVATGWFVPVAFLLFLLWRAPHLDSADWDYDEGINLMKSLLVNRGLPLYTVVWNDQPPILTMLLSAVFAVTEQSVMWGAPSSWCSRRSCSGVFTWWRTGRYLLLPQLRA